MIRFNGKVPAIDVVMNFFTAKISPIVSNSSRQVLMFERRRQPVVPACLA